jgi:hypothetical protein
MRTRTIAILAAAFALAVVATITVGSLPRSQAQPEPAPAPSTAPAVPQATSYNHDAGDAGEDAEAPPETQEALWSPVVDNFGRNFTNTSGGTQKWRQRLIGPTATPYVTTEVADQLKTVDTRNVPDGRYTSHELLKSSPFEIAVKIDYREGWAMVLYLITDGTHWQIHAYDKWED